MGSSKRPVRPLDQVAAHEPVARLRQAREEHLGGLVGADRVVESEERVGVHDRALGLDAELGEDGLRHLDAAASGVRELVAIDDLPRDRLVLRRNDGDALGARVDSLANGVQELATARDLVQEDEDRAARDVDFGRTGPVVLYFGHVVARRGRADGRGFRLGRPRGPPLHA